LTNRLYVLLLVTLFLPVAPGTAAEDDEWVWSVAPYIWATETKYDLSANGVPIAGGSISFKELNDNLESSFVLYAETGKGKWSGFVDVNYLEIDELDERTLLSVRTNSKQLYLDVALSYWPSGLGSNLNFYGGLRRTALDDDYDISTIGGTPITTLNNDQSYNDVLLGLRYRFDLSERWRLHTRGDVSFGDSEGTWSLQALFGYTVGSRQKNEILIGYRLKEAELEDGNLNTEFTYSGPIAGFRFRF